jgi:putative addiction module component (TIGR02574 family)
MSTITLNDVKNEAMLLSVKERALLILELLESLDSVQDEEIENAWINEAEKRYARYVAGETKTRSASDVFANIQAQLQ